jgi:hypothetical protein
MSLPLHWSTPVAIELLFPERTRGGVYVEHGTMVLDLSFGVKVFRIRHTLQDFARGAYGVFPLRNLQQRPDLLDDALKRAPSSETGKTVMRLHGTGPEMWVDLALVRSDLGYP